jgi:hypothetical protein
MINAGSWAVVVAVVAVVASAISAWYTVKKSTEAVTAGFRASEDVKADLVGLIAALRSLILKGIQSDQDGKYRDVQADIEAVRRFQTSPSGLGLSLLAAKRGSSSEPTSGNWRVLGLEMADLTGIVLTDQATAATTLTCRKLATGIEQTLSLIKQEDVDWVTSKIRDLDVLLTTLVDSRSQDMILGIWFGIFTQNQNQTYPAKFLPQLEKLEAAGVDDPDLQLWLALLRDQPDEGKKALESGASPATTIDDLLKRHDDDLKEP